MNKRYRSMADRKITFGKWVMVGTAALLGFMWVYGDPIPQERYFIGTVIGCLSVIPILIYLYDKRQGQIPLMALNAASYLISFAVQSFFAIPPVTIVHYTEAAMQQACLVCMGGLAAQIAGYYLTRSLVGPGTQITFTAGMDLSRVRFLAWSFGLLTLIQLLFP